MEIFVFTLLVFASVQIGLAVLLYRLGQQRFDSGMPWALAGCFFGVFGLVAFYLAHLRQEAMDRTRARAEYVKIKGVVQHHRETVADYEQAIHTGGDPEVDRLIAAQRLEEAGRYVAEKLRVAYEMGDSEREALYRRYRMIIDTRADWPENG